MYTSMDVVCVGLGQMVERRRYVFALKNTGCNEHGYAPGRLGFVLHLPCICFGFVGFVFIG